MSIDYSKYITKVLPDEFDERDYIFAAKLTMEELPSKYINPNIDEIENQLSTGSCVANSCASSLEMMAHKEHDINLSRMFIYYNIRKDYPNLAEQDGGAYLRDAYKYVNREGVCEESVWDFDVDKVNDKPSEEAYEKAIENKVLKYERIYVNVNDVKEAVRQEQGVIMSMQLGKDFYSIKGPLADHDYREISSFNPHIGNHAMSIVGWDDDLGGFIIENSWGIGWGDKGLFLLDYDVFIKDVYDIWTSSKFQVGEEDIVPEPNTEPGFFTKAWDSIKSIFEEILNYILGK